MSANLVSMVAAAAQQVGTSGPLYALLIALAQAGGSGGTPQEYAGILVVSPSGTTGQRNTLVPFPTVAAALAAAQSNDLVLVMPGTYTQNLVIPAALTALSIKGVGRYACRILPAAGDAITQAPTVDQELYISDLTVEAAGRGITATGLVGGVNTSALRLFNCTIRGTVRAVQLTRYDSAAAQCCDLGDLQIDNSNSLQLSLCDLADSFFNVAASTPPGVAHESYRIECCKVATLTQQGVCTLVVDAATKVAGGYDATAVVNDGTTQGTIDFHGEATSLDIERTGANPISVDIKQARIGTLTAENNGSTDQTLDARGAVLGEVDLSAASDLLILQNRGGAVDAITGLTARCYIDRDSDGRTIAVTLAPGVNALAFQSGDLSQVPGFGSSLYVPVITLRDATTAFTQIPYWNGTATLDGFEIVNPDAADVVVNISFIRRLG